MGGGVSKVRNAKKLKQSETKAETICVQNKVEGGSFLLTRYANPNHKHQKQKTKVSNQGGWEERESVSNG